MAALFECTSAHAHAAASFFVRVLVASDPQSESTSDGVLKKGSSYICSRVASCGLPVLVDAGDRSQNPISKCAI